MSPQSNTPGHSTAFWVLVIGIVNAVHLWLFYKLGGDSSRVQFWVTIAIHLIGCVGPFWILTHWFVKRQKPLRWRRWMWLVFVPWGFLWYVFEKWEPAVSDLDRFRGTYRAPHR